MRSFKNHDRDFRINNASITMLGFQDARIPFKYLQSFHESKQIVTREMNSICMRP
jgi:hypothetical protein